MHAETNKIHYLSQFESHDYAISAWILATCVHAVTCRGCYILEVITVFTS